MIITEANQVFLLSALTIAGISAGAALEGLTTEARAIASLASTVFLSRVTIFLAKVITGQDRFKIKTGLGATAFLTTIGLAGVGAGEILNLDPGIKNGFIFESIITALTAAAAMSALELGFTTWKAAGSGTLVAATLGGALMGPLGTVGAGVLEELWPQSVLSR